MAASLRIARVFGIDVKVHVTFLAVIAASAYEWRRFGSDGLIYGVLSTLALFACIALHELGHSVVAQRFGIRVREILLFPLGGVAKLEGLPKRPLHEVLIALAGPAVNVVIAAALAGAVLLSDERDNARLVLIHLATPLPTPMTFVVLLGMSNAVLAAFNLLPAFPMDGGRVLRAGLSWLMSAETATRIAALLGRALAVVFVVVGLAVESQRMLLFVALVVVLAGSAELQLQQYISVLASIRVKDVMNAQAPRLTREMTVEDAVLLVTRSPLPAYAVESFGTLLGVVTREAIIDAAKKKGAGTTLVTSVMEPTTASIGPDDVLDRAREVMTDVDKSYVAVKSGGVFLGLITDLELAHQLSVTKSLRG